MVNGKTRSHSGCYNDCPIDLADAMKRFDDDGIFYKKVVIDFLDRVPAEITELTEASRAGDSQTTRRYAHSIKGTAGTLSARRLYSLARQIETGADQSDVQTLLALIDDLKSEVQRIGVFAAAFGALGETT